MKRASLFKIVSSSVVFAVVSSVGAQSPDDSTVRHERRAEIVKLHYGMAAALSLDQARYERLIELLTDQEMQRRESSVLRPGVTTDYGDVTESLVSSAERANRNLDALRGFLGQAEFDRYQALRFSLWKRPQVSELNDHLGAAHKLSASQIEKLVGLVLKDTMAELEQYQRAPAVPLQSENVTTREPPSQEQVQRHWNLTSLAANQELLQRSTKGERQLLQEAAAFLTEPQLGRFQQLHAAQTTEIQNRVVQMRRQLGLNPTIPDRSDAVAEGGFAAVAGEVKLNIKTVVNRDKPQYFAEVVSSNESTTFQIGDGMVLQAIVTLYRHNLYELRLAYYEVGTTGKRWIGGSRTTGAVVQLPLGDPSRDLAGGDGSVLTGDKAYAIQLRSLIEPA